VHIVGRALLISALLITAQTARATTLRAGEWETIIDGGRRSIVCIPADKNFDQATVSKLMSSAGIKCNVSAFQTLGPVTTSAMVCEVAGGHLSVRSTFTFNGQDSYITRSISHLEGGSVKMPDMDMTQTAHRLGACKPGDRQSRY